MSEQRVKQTAQVESLHPQAMKILLAGVISLLMLGAGACGKPTDDQYKDPAIGIYEIDPILLAYYDHLGGIEKAGKAISPAIKQDDITIQYVEAGKIIYDGTAPIARWFSMAPLGLELGINEPPVAQPEDSAIPYINGHTISPEFYRAYEALKPPTVGKPLTEMRYHLVHKRYEQYFENLGFYREEGSSEVHLLPYGTWACQQECRIGSGIKNSAPDISSYIDPIFQDFVSKFGTDFTGLALTDLYQDSEGRWIQIFENVVLSADSRQDPQDIRLMPICEKVDIQVEKIRPPSAPEKMYLYRLQDQLGYEIPLEFMDYINKHGGFDLIGQPITHFSELEKGFFNQCFVNLCLTYDPSMVDGARVRPAPLGFPFVVLNYNSEVESEQLEDPPLSIPEDKTPEVSDPSFQPDPPADSSVTEKPVLPDDSREINLRVRKVYDTIEPDQRQEIQIWLEENGEPASNKIVELTLTLPDGSQHVFRMVPTNLNGQSSLLLPLIEAQNGTIVAFKACYSATQKMKFCDADVFVIWNNP